MYYVQLFPGVYLLHNGVIIEANSKIFITDIGITAPHHLVCLTDRNPCCRSPHTVGDWIFPNATNVGLLGSNSRAAHFYTNRGINGEINLYRVSSDVISPTGRFCCRVPNVTNINHTICINVGEC